MIKLAVVIVAIMRMNTEIYKKSQLSNSDNSYVIIDKYFKQDINRLRRMIMHKIILIILRFSLIDFIKISFSNYQRNHEVILKLINLFLNIIDLI